MSTREKLIKARMGMLALAEELSNVSRACRRAGISRSHFYEIKDAYEKYGRDGLAPEIKRRPRMPNQTPPELEAQILEMTGRYPTLSYLRLSDQLKLIGLPISPSTVRCVWLRHGLTLRYHRLLWLEQKTAAEGGLASNQRLLRTLQPNREERILRRRFPQDPLRLRRSAAGRPESLPRFLQPRARPP
jgi:Homeodomain-like domain